MFWSPRLPVTTLIDVCRSMKYALGGGMLVPDVMGMMAKKGTPAIRKVAMRVSEELNAGWSLHEAIERQEDAFPPLFIALVTVGEESGTLPEILGELEKYYLLQQRLRAQFWSQIRWPLLQLLIAALIVALVIFVTGSVKIYRGMKAEALDPLGIGLVGATGALTFLGIAASCVLGFLILKGLLKRLLPRITFAHRILLRLPLVGGCARALAVMRFSLAAHLMLDTKVSVLRALRLALAATDNPAFRRVYPRVESAIRGGHDIATSLTKADIFPARFLGVLSVAEDSGKLPEALKFQADEYEEEARRRMTTLTQVISGLVWVFFASLIILIIFRFFENINMKALDTFLEQYLDGQPGPGKKI